MMSLKLMEHSFFITKLASRQKAKRVKQSPAHANLDGKIYERFSKNINEELKHIKNNAGEFCDLELQL